MITAWLAMTVATVASTTIGSSNISGTSTIERIVDRARVGEHQCALSEIVDQQSRKNEIEPCDLDRLAAEMSEIGIERLAAGDGKEDRAERDQAERAVFNEKPDRIIRVDRGQHAGIVGNMQCAANRHSDKPDDHDRAEQDR